MYVQLCMHQMHHSCNVIGINSKANLDVVNTKELDLCLALDLHVDPLAALGEHEVEGVEVDLASVPLNLLCAAHPCNQG